MTPEPPPHAVKPQPGAEAAATSDPSADARPARAGTPPPGLMAIALYMLLLAGVTILGVANGALRPFYALFAAGFIAASLGLLLLFRWAWAMALAALVLLFGLFLWKFTRQHDLPSLAQGLLNLVFFLYMVRPEVRVRLR